MNDAATVGKCHGFADSQKHFQQLKTVFGFTAARGQQVLHADAVDPLHGVINGSVAQFTKVVNRNDTRMLKLSRDLRFVNEATDIFRIGGGIGQDFACHFAMAVAIIDAVDDPLRSFAKFSD